MQNIWIVGAGLMADHYIDVIVALGYQPVVIGRGEKSAVSLEKRKKIKVIRGGLKKFLKKKPDTPMAACVISDVTQLAENTIDLIDFGVGRIITEKPGFLNKKDGMRIQRKLKDKDIIHFIGYNRRFFSSSIFAKNLIEEEGGVVSFCFDFSDPGDDIGKLSHSKIIKKKWFLCNSTHVVDLAFYLGGSPASISCSLGGSKELKWHPNASRFSGSGITKSGANFSYIANWNSPGRWGLEVTTKNYKMIMRPMEQMQIMQRGSFKTQQIRLKNQLDRKFKPGLYLQLKEFLKSEKNELSTVDNQLAMWSHYNKISGYQQ